MCVRRLPVWQWTFVTLLLLVEVIAFSIRFDTALLRQGDGTWSWLLGQTSLVCRFSIAAVTAVLLFGGQELLNVGRSRARFHDSGTFSGIGLAAHFAALLALYQASITVFVDDAHVSPLLYCVWIVSGVVAIACLAATVVPVSLWGAVAHFSVKVFVACIVLAMVAIWAGQLADYLWLPLARATFQVVSGVLGLFYSPVIALPDELCVGTNSFSVEIAPSCSGYEGIGLVVVFLSAFLWWFRKELKFPQALLLLPLGIVLIWFANALRIAGLIIVGSSFSPEVAAGGFHSQAGWIAFNAIVLGLIATVWNSQYFSLAAAAATSKDSTTSYPAAPFLVPFLVWVATAMLAAAISAGGFDRLYVLKVLSAAAALIYFRSTYRRLHILSWSWSWQSVALGILVFAIWMALEPWSGAARGSSQSQVAELATMPAAIAAAWYAFRALGSIVIAPLVEELAFRGFLTRRLIATDFDSVPIGRFTVFSCLFSSVLFGMLHGRWLAGALAGLLFATALYRRGRLMDAVLAHATANSLITGYVLATGELATWS